MRTGTLFVDPGKTTGYAWLLDGDHPDEATVGQAPAHEFVRIAAGFLSQRPGSRIVCEQYRITAQTLKKTRQPWSIEIIGVLKHWHQQTFGATYEEQRPGDALGLITDDVLAAFGVLASSDFDHANDACRHMLLWLLKRGFIDAQEVADAKL